MVETIGKSTRDSLVRAEKLSREAALGDADPQQVTFEVLKSKAALYQLTVLVNTTPQACQELLRMGVQPSNNPGLSCLVLFRLTRQNFNFVSVVTRHSQQARPSY